MYNDRLTGALLVTALLIAGCSPHPGAGTWVPLAGAESRYERLEVMFEGRAEFYLPAAEEADLRCFWSGESGRDIALQCSSAGNPDVDLHFRLKTRQSGEAELLQGGRTLMLMRRKPLSE